MHATNVDVRFSELDPYGHVNHAVYLNYFEIGRIDALDTAGMSLGWLQQEGFHVPVIEVAVRFRRSAGLGDRLTVCSGLTELRPASARWRQHITLGDQELALATVRSAVTDRDGRPCRGPANWKDMLAALLLSPDA